VLVHLLSVPVVHYIVFLAVLLYPVHMVRAGKLFAYENFGCILYGFLQGKWHWKSYYWHVSCLVVKSLGMVNKGWLRSTDVAVKVLKDCPMGEVSAISSYCMLWHLPFDLHILTWKLETHCAEVQIVGIAIAACVVSIQLACIYIGISTTGLSTLVFALTLLYHQLCMSWWLVDPCTHICT